MPNSSPHFCAPSSSPSRYTGRNRWLLAMKSGRANTLDFSVWQNGHHSAPQYSNTGRFSRLATTNAPCRLPSNHAISRGSLACVACCACGGSVVAQPASSSTRLRQNRRASMTLRSLHTRRPRVKVPVIEYSNESCLHELSKVHERCTGCAPGLSLRALSWVLAGPAPGAARRQRLERIVRPMVLGVAAAHVLAHFAIAAAPETGQIARDLYRALGRRQQLERHRYRTVGDARGFHKPEDFLQPHRDARRIGVDVIDTNARTARHHQFARRKRLQCAPLRVTQAATQGLRQRYARQLIAARDAAKVRRQPLPKTRQQRRVLARRPIGEVAPLQ